MYLSPTDLTRRVVIAGAVVTAAIAAVAIGFTAPLDLPGYSLSILTASGDAYIVDHGLTLSDCVRLWDEFPPNVTLECARDGAV